MTIYTQSCINLVYTIVLINMHARAVRRGRYLGDGVPKRRGVRFQLDLPPGNAPRWERRESPEPWGRPPPGL